jgi:hypothetical protein
VSQPSLAKLARRSSRRQELEVCGGCSTDAIDRGLLRASRIAAVAGALVAVVGVSVAPSSAASPRPSTDPYEASVACSKCMRRHGFPMPMPNRRGDIHLSRLLRRRSYARSGRRRSTPPARCASCTSRRPSARSRSWEFSWSPDGRYLIAGGFDAEVTTIGGKRVAWLRGLRALDPSWQPRCRRNR